MKEAVNRAEKEKPFLASKAFNTNLVQFLHRIMLLLVTCAITHVHGCAPKTV